MSSIPKVSLDDTLHLVQLMRETALSKGRETQAKRLSPVMDEMRNLAQAAQSQVSAPASAGILGQADFKKLLSVSQTKATQPVQSTQASSAPQGTSSLSSILERNRLISAMSAASMSDVDIARQFGMSRDEVRLVLNVQQSGQSSNEVIK
jgi:hypothetical protein